MIELKDKLKFKNIHQIMNHNSISFQNTYKIKIKNWSYQNLFT